VALSAAAHQGIANLAAAGMESLMAFKRADSDAMTAKFVPKAAAMPKAGG
jgi:delta-aminolevulinic acid dehydratase/porphobilinogen synthase